MKFGSWRILLGTVFAVLCGTVGARDLVWTGAQGNAWDLTTANWHVADDETKTPVAYEEGDNVLFDDTATSYTVQIRKINETSDHQFDIGNIVFSNEVNTYVFTATVNPWMQKYGAFGTIDKWGAARVDVGTRLETAKDFCCHAGIWRCLAGSSWVGEYRSCVGSLHDARTVTFSTNSVMDLNTGSVLGAATSAGPVSFKFLGACVSNNVTAYQNLGSATFSDALYYGRYGSWTFFSGNSTVTGTRPFMMTGVDGHVTFSGNNVSRTWTVEDVTGDAGYDMVISNKVVDLDSYTAGWPVRLMNRMVKRGPGTLAFMNSLSTTTGIVDVAEGTVVFDFAGGWNSGYSSVAGLLDSASGAHGRVIVRDGATVYLPRSVPFGEMNNPMAFELSISNATLKIADRTFQHFGTLRLHDATLDWQNAYQNNWINYDFLGCSTKLVLSGSIPYDFQPKGLHPSYADLSDNCTFRLGFNLNSVIDDHPIPQAGTDPTSANWAKYSKFTNIWTVVDFVVEDITKNDDVDATMGWTIKNMPNMSYVTINSSETWGMNPWKRYRFNGGIRKLGAGTFRTTGRNTYTHTTEVAEGALLVDGSIASSSGVTVDAGAYLGGTGVVSCATLVKDNGGLLVPFERGRTKVLQVASLTTEGAVRVRVQNPTHIPRHEFKQNLLRIADKPAAVNFRNWVVDCEGAPSPSGFKFCYDASTGIVSAYYDGGTLLIFR